jgi:uncharacterized membrane protein
MPSLDRDRSFIRRLHRELDVWLSESLISPEQKDHILARYAEIGGTAERSGSGKLITTITVLGSILVGVGILLFVASNWSAVPRWGKLSIIFVSLLFAYGLGFILRYEKQNYPKAGAALILLGSLIFGAGIFLIAQIYHITVHYPNGPLLWGMAVLPLAYLLRFRSILTLAIMDLLLWLGMEASFQIMPFALTGGVAIMVTLYLMAGMTLWTAGLVHRGFPFLRELSGPYILAGMFIMLSAFFVMTFNVFRGPLGAQALMPFYITLSVLFLLAFGMLFLTKEKTTGWLPEIIALGVLMAVAVTLCLLYRVDIGVPYYRGRFDSTSTVIMLISNLVFFLTIIGIIVLGYLRHNTGYINMGLLFFVLDVIARYFDFFWKLLPRSLFFIGGGIILLAGGVLLEKKRRKVLASFSIEESTS